MEYLGTWEIKKCIVHENSQIKSALEGCRFTLESSGDVTWKPLYQEAANIPLLSCDDYKIYCTETCNINNKKIFFCFNAYNGESLDFSTPYIPDDPSYNSVVLECWDWCTIHCVRVINDDADIDPNHPYTLLPAVEEGFFSDMVIEAQDNKQFHVHASILGLLGSDMCWMREPPPFTGLPEAVLGAILHWLYSECLPQEVDEELAVQVMQALAEYPCMAPLHQHCQMYLNYMAYKQKIVDIVSDMHTFFNQIIQYFAPEEKLGSHPTKLCLVIKQCFRESAVVVVKMLVLCEVITQDCGSLPKRERQEIVKYVRSRVPVFVSQAKRLSKALNTTLAAMSHTQRKELATYIAPEIEAIMTTVSSLLFEVKIALEQIMLVLSPESPKTNGDLSDASVSGNKSTNTSNNSTNPSKTSSDSSKTSSDPSNNSLNSSKITSNPCSTSSNPSNNSLNPNVDPSVSGSSSSNSGNNCPDAINNSTNPSDNCSNPANNSSKTEDILTDILGRKMKQKDLARLKSFHKKVSITLEHLLYKKESFVSMSCSSMLRCVVRNLELVIENLPIRWMGDVTHILGDHLGSDWGDFQYRFKLATTRISCLLQKLRMHRNALGDVLQRLCGLVEKDAFTQGLVELGLLDQVARQSSGKAASTATTASDAGEGATPTQHAYKLSLVQMLMRPPLSRDSCLSKAAGSLLHSERHADMVFEIPLNTTVGHTSTPMPTNTRRTSNHLTSPTEQKATLSSQANNSSSESGAQDSSSDATANNSNSVIIKAHRVIVAAKCDWFRRALQSGMKEAIHRKIVIHDTTPAHFRKLLNYLYTGRLDTRSSTPEQLTELILLGDRYELETMKLACEKALALMHLDKETTFYYLTLADQYNAAHLKEACMKYILSESALLDCPEFHELPASLQSAVYSQLDTFTAPSAYNLPVKDDMASYDSGDEGSNSDSSGGGHMYSCGRLNDCLARLRDVLGPDVPVEDLNRVALAADCDANRAINFYYNQARSSSNTSQSRES